MTEEHPKPYQVIDHFIEQDIVTYTKTSVIIEHKIRALFFILVFVFALAVGFMLVRNPGFFLYSDRLIIPYYFILFYVSAGIILMLSGKRSYRYEFDKENQQIRCKWVGFQGIHIDKRKEITYPLSDLRYIRVDLLWGSRNHSLKFKLKAVLKNRKELELPAGRSLRECLEDANMYRDFLEISPPIELPG